MKKIVSLVLAMVLMVSVFAMLGTLTASAETYEVSKELVNLTFEGDAPYGFAAGRTDGGSYNKEGGYATITSLGTSNHSVYLAKDGTIGETIVARTNTDDFNAFNETQKAAYENLLKFDAGKTYTVSFDYQLVKGTVAKRAADNKYDLDYLPGVMLMHNPLLKTADSNGYTIDKRTASYTSNVPYTVIEESDLVAGANEGDFVLAENTDWVSVYFTFTVKEDDPGFALGFHNGAGTGRNTIMNYDNIVVKEILGSYTYTDTGVYTLDDQPAFTKASGPEGTYVENYDEKHGTVLKIAGDATSNRGGFKVDDFKVEKGKKYYISFEAKADAAGEIANVLCDYTSPVNRRHFMSGYNSKYQGVKYFINGNEITVNSGNKKNVMPVTTEWQTYGLTIDTADEGFLEAVLSNNPTNSNYINFWNYDIYYMFGSTTTTYFDNFKIVEMTEPAISAVPEKDASAKYSIRKEAAGLSAGLRFKGNVDASVKAAADEIGFVVAPAELVYGEENWYKVDSLNKNAKKAVAYNDTKDVVYSSNADTVSYQLVLTNLGKLASRRFAAVMYVKTGDTYTYISLGEISYNTVAAEYAVRGK